MKLHLYAETDYYCFAKVLFNNTNITILPYNNIMLTQLYKCSALTQARQLCILILYTLTQYAV